RLGTEGRHRPRRNRLVRDDPLNVTVDRDRVDCVQRTPRRVARHDLNPAAVAAEPLEEHLAAAFTLQPATAVGEALAVRPDQQYPPPGQPGTIGPRFVQSPAAG